MPHRFEDLEQLKLIVDVLMKEHLETRKGVQLDELTLNVDRQGNIKPFKRFGETREDVVAICELKIPFKFRNSSDGDNTGTIRTESFIHQIYDSDIYMISLADVLARIREDNIDDIIGND